jgi:hypothetical protein
MTPQEAIKIIETAIAEVEWEYPMDYAVAFETAVNALNKQIPKKPKGITDPIFGDITIVCPNCCNANLDNPFDISRVYDYCPNCGQAIDWSESE